MYTSFLKVFSNDFYSHMFYMLYPKSILSCINNKSYTHRYSTNQRLQMLWCIWTNRRKTS